MPPAHHASWGIWLAVVAAIGFSFKAILIKLAYPYGVDAVTLLALRMVFSLPAYLFVGLREQRSAAPLSRRDWATVAVLGVTGYYGASFLDFLGLQYISAGLERIILFTYPTLVLLLSWVFFGRRITGRQTLALALCYAGIAAAFAHDLRLGGTDGGAVWLGGALVFSSAVAYSVYLVGNGELVARVGTLRFTAWAMLAASAACILQFLLTRPLSALDLPWQVYAFAVLMAVFCTVLPSFMITAAIRRIGSGPTSLIGAVGPVATIFLGAWLLDEPISAIQLGGAALVMLGVWLIGQKRG